MIVFNLWCIPVGIAILVVVGLLDILLEQFGIKLVSGPYGTLTIGGVTAVIGYGFELIDWKARLFWIPVYILGALAAVYGGYENWSWLGAGGVALALVPIYFGKIFLEKGADRRAWARAKESLSQAMQAQGNPAEMWPALQEAFYFPASIPLESEMVRHDLRVLETVNARLGLDVEEKTQTELDELGELLRKIEPESGLENLSEKEAKRMVRRIESLMKLMDKEAEKAAKKN